MKISIITVFPEIFDSFFKVSLVARAIEKQLVEFNLVRFSDMCVAKKRIDQPTCGPGAGMIIKPEVVEKAIDACEKKWGKGFKIFFSPQGKKLNQKLLKNLADRLFASAHTLRQAQGERVFNPDAFDNPNNYRKDKVDLCNGEQVNTAAHPELVEGNERPCNHLILICSRYEGIDERVEQHYSDLTLSIGDYVVMGGDIPAQVFLEGLLRFLPGVVGKDESVEKDSFSQAFLDYPEYGLPVEWKGLRVPEIVLSGNHAAIEKWRGEQAAKKTIGHRFDWFASSSPTQKEIEIAEKFIPNHYVALMHADILVKKDQVGNNSITSLDIHDISRSSATYGIKNYFMVTPLEDQQKILGTFLEFWKSKEGREYNKSRFDAVSRVVPATSIDDVIERIIKKEGVTPIIISTSARESEFEGLEKPKVINYHQQGIVFQQRRPVLIVFGTAWGLSDQILKRSDYLLHPVKGMTDYNHLSVRSAAAIVLDRWLGLNAR